MSVSADSLSVPIVLQRLGGIEAELKEMRGLIAQLVRIEEQEKADRAEIARLGLELATMRNQIATLSDRSLANGFTVSAVRQTAIVAGTALAALIVGWISRGGQ